MLRFRQGNSLAPDDVRHRPRAEREVMDRSRIRGMILLPARPCPEDYHAYSALSKVNNVHATHTAEDPFEYNLLDHQFSCGLSRILRRRAQSLPAQIQHHHGREIRVSNAARHKAALTGHLVLSTLHTNSAPSGDAIDYMASNIPCRLGHQPHRRPAARPRICLSCSDNRPGAGAGDGKGQRHYDDA